jgi:hypothetical protein
MRFYNPFKWHVVKVSERYVLRRRALMWMEYFCKDYTMTWVIVGHALEFDSYKTYDEANHVLENIGVKKVWS